MEDLLSQALSQLLGNSPLAVFLVAYIFYRERQRKQNGAPQPPCVDNQKALAAQNVLLEQLVKVGESQVNEIRRVGDNVNALSRQQAGLEGRVEGLAEGIRGG